MKFLAVLLVTISVAYGAVLPLKPNCATAFCTLDLKICPDGTPAPIPVGGCCPSLSACKPVTNPILPINNCLFTFCTMDIKICPDGTPAPIPVGGCCPSLSACKPVINSRTNPLSSLLSGSNLLQTLSSATQGTNLGTAISILNLINNIQQLSNDIHQIPAVINETLANIINGTGQATQVILNQLITAATGGNHQNGNRNLLDTLGQGSNLLSSIGHLLPQGTSISTVISILNLLNNINTLSNDINQIPAVLNETLASIINGTGQATQALLNQLVSAITAGNNQNTNRNLLDTLGQGSNLLSSITHLLPQGTSISTVLSILNLLNNINTLSNDINQIPAVLQETLQNILNGVQNLLPPTIQPVQGSS